MSENKTLTSKILSILWFLAFILASVITVYLGVELSRNESFIDDNAGLVSALFILLAASIASASVMKSIEENKELKKYELYQEYLTQLIFIQNTLMRISKKCIDLPSSNDHEKDLKIILEKWNSIIKDKYAIHYVNYEAKEIIEFYDVYDLFHSVEMNLFSIDKKKPETEVKSKCESINKNISTISLILELKQENIEEYLNLTKPPNTPFIDMLRTTINMDRIF